MLSLNAFFPSHLGSVNRNTRLTRSEGQGFSDNSFTSKILKFLIIISSLHSPQLLSVNPMSLLPQFLSVLLMPPPLPSPTSNETDILQYFKQIFLYSPQILTHFSKMLLRLPQRECLNKLWLVGLPVCILQLQNPFCIELQACKTKMHDVCLLRYTDPHGFSLFPRFPLK